VLRFASLTQYSFSRSFFSPFFIDLITLTCGISGAIAVAAILAHLLRDIRSRDSYIQQLLILQNDIDCALSLSLPLLFFVTVVSIVLPLQHRRLVSICMDAQVTSTLF
jgi:hypothetical protein